jgi:hypothetical protein
MLREMLNRQPDGASEIPRRRLPAAGPRRESALDCISKKSERSLAPVLRDDLAERIDGTFGGLRICETRQSSGYKTLAIPQLMDAFCILKTLISHPHDLFRLPFQVLSVE